jgi:hypothetical protein
MPPLIIYFVGFVAVLLYFLLPLWLAAPIAIALVLIALFRLRKLGRARQQRDELDQTGAVLPIAGDNSENNTPAKPGSDEAAQSHHGHHHEHGSPDDNSSGHSSHHHDPPSFGGGDGGAHHGGFDGGGHGH